MNISNAMNIIVLALPRWDGRYSSTSLSLSKELSKKHKVFYVDNPFTVKDVITRLGSKQIRSRLIPLLFGFRKFKVADGFPNLTYVTPRMVLPINFLSVGKLYSFFSVLNDRLVYLSISDLLKKHQLRDFIFINSYNPFYSLNFPGNFRPQLRIYHCVDDISESKYVARHGVRLEKRMMTTSDLTLATSLKLVTLKRPYANKVFYLPNAADFDHFQKYLNNEKVEDIANISTEKSVVGYIGNVCHRLDYQLLFEVIRKHEDKIFLFVGPISTEEVKESGVFDLSNAIFVGSKKMIDLPRYLHRMDCTIIPFKLNKLTESIYPLKINEYLSMGKPVVSTEFSEDIYQFQEHISLVKSSNDFVQAIGEELAADNEERKLRRMEVASSNTWQSRGQKFWEILNEFQ